LSTPATASLTNVCTWRKRSAALKEEVGVSTQTQGNWPDQVRGGSSTEPIGVLDTYAQKGAQLLNLGLHAPIVFRSRCCEANDLGGNHEEVARLAVVGLHYRLFNSIPHAGARRPPRQSPGCDATPQVECSKAGCSQRQGGGDGRREKCTRSLFRHE
jgi:hypothetical protein